MLSYTEENYLKSIFHLGSKNEERSTSTNVIADDLSIKPATVTSMLKKLREKNYIIYERYGKVKLTETGRVQALQIIRKHRLWEVFLVDKLHFSWDEVHEIAEQLEHIQSSKLIDKLDAFLDYPKYDPHGDPIPDIEGRLKPISSLTLSDALVGKSYTVVAVNDSSAEFLKYLMQLKITLSAKLDILERIQYDQSLRIRVNNTHEIMISEKTSMQLIIR